MRRNVPMNAVPSDQVVNPVKEKTIDPWRVHPHAEDLFREHDEPVQGKLASELAALKIPDLRVLSASGAKALYSRDQADVPDMMKSAMFRSMPDVVVQPFSVEAIQGVMRFATEKRVPVIVRGAGSSPFGGSMPVTGGIVVDMNAMDQVLTLDPAAATVKVQAGIRWADLEWYLEKKGLSVRSLPSSRFSTVGGWVVAGGIGIGSVSSGRLINSVLALDIVTASGEMKTVAPGDGMFAPVFGSEGQLAVVTAITLKVRPRPSATYPQLVFFDDLPSAISYANALATTKHKPMDLTYYSPIKFKAFNQVMHRDDYPVAHGILVTYEGKNDPANVVPVPAGAKVAPLYLAHLMANERFFPMKSRRLGPGLMGAEVLAPRANLAKIVEKALEVCARHGIEPMLEVHFLDDGDGMLLCYYITNQTRQLKYTMDSFRGLLISKALYDEGAKPYSFGVWNHSFADQADPEEAKALAEAKKQLDPQNIMNRGKYPHLGGKFGGLPAAFFSPAVLGSALRLVNKLGKVSATGINVIASGDLMVREEKDELLDAADQCAMCGACVGVCPAYTLTRDERVTARGKLLTARQMSTGKPISEEHAHLTFLCMRCKACEQVCQSKLALVPLYEIMERKLAQQHGRDDEQIKRFIEVAEHSAFYDALVDRGLVLGAPGKNVEGRL
ncbi:MAG: FAD-binding protein [Methanomassiliicoccus sp.]|nr:FAD-binding protein [Methanomassiliicoccus sp.]